MGWFESKVCESAWPQVENTVSAIMADPYLMPPCPIFSSAFESMAAGDNEAAKWIIDDMIRGIIKSLHHIVKDGAGDHEINLLAFWKFLVMQGEKENYSSFIYAPVSKGLEKEYPEGNTMVEVNYIEQPLCVWARIKYFQAERNLKTHPFLIPCQVKQIHGVWERGINRFFPC